MLKLVELKMMKTTLFLTELEIMVFLPAQIIETGIRRGKFEQRRRKARQAGEKAGGELLNGCKDTN